jgi:flagellar L-ring protein precursor FlgH
MRAPKEYRVHDHIRVLVRERARGHSTADLRTDRRSRWETDFDKFIRLRSTGHVLPELGAAALADDPGIDIDARYRNDNLARTTREFTLEFTIMAEVVDVRPNGVLVIEAVSERTINGEDETIRLTGEVSPHHIRDDTVVSDDIVNKRIRYEGSGTISDNVRPGIIGWILQKIWPF